MPLISSLGVMNAINFGMASSGKTTKPSTAVVYAGSSRNFHAYPWSDAGFGTMFSDPSTVIPATGSQTCFNPTGNAVGVGVNSSSYCYVYSFSASTGIGTKFADPAILPSGTNGYGFCFSKDGNTISVGVDASPFIATYSWSNGFGTKFADPSTLPAGTVFSIKFNPSSTLTALAHGSGTKSSVYPWSVSGFGTKFADAASYPGGSMTGRDICFSPDGSSIGLSIGNLSSGTNAIFIYPWSNGYGTKYSNPTLPVGISYCNGITFSVKGNALIFSTDSSTDYERIIAFKWISGSGFGTQYSSPVEPPSAASFGKVNMESSGKYVGLAFNGGSGTSPYSSAMAYKWDDTTGFGTMYRAPSGGGNGQGIAFN